MRTAYIARSVIPSQSANSIHVMKISEEFARLCEEFELIVPSCEDSDIKEDPFIYYGIEVKFPIRRIRKKINGWYRYYFALKCMRQIKKDRIDRIVTRDPLVAFLAVLRHKKVVLDLHGEVAHLAGRAYRIMKWNFFVKNPRLKLVMITESLAKYYEKKYGVDPETVTVLPDGCTIENFVPYYDMPLLDEESMKIAYAGSLGEGRGYEIIEELARSDEKNRYIIYGGTREDVVRITGREQPDNIEFRGYIANREIPKALCEQDILLLPYQNKVIAKGEDTGKVMSPLKLFESMASGRVIIASDLQILREIVDETDCYLADSNNAADWKRILQEISGNREAAREKAAKAMEDVKQYTWRKRAEKMLKLFESDN